MSFLTPAMLWALPVALIPLIIYLLMRFRTLRVDWGADYVLLKALERMRKRLFLDQIILILLRTLALVALVLAFARPVSESAGAVASGTGIHRVVVVDCSYSMLATAGEESRWERVRAVVEELAASWGRNERWSLYAIDGQPGWRVRDAAIASSEEVLAALDLLEPVETEAAVGRALDEVLQTAVAGPTEIYLVTDDQATTWEDARSLSVPQREDLRVFWIRPGATVQDNLAVTGVVPGTDRVLAGHPLRVFVSVRNFGRDPQLEVPVEVLIDGRFAGRESISLQPGQELEAEVDLRFERAGSHVVSARIGDDALAFDNEAATGIMVERAMDVAVLRDPDRDDLFESSHPFLELAARVLDERSDSGLAPFTVSLVDGSVDATTLAGFDCVLLDGEDPIPARIEEAENHVALTLPGGSSRSGAGSFLLVSGSGTDRIHVGVQGPRLDSDLRAIPDAEREQLVDRLQLEPVTTWEELSELLRTTRQGAERYTWVLVAMLLFLFGELFVARRFV